MAKKNVMAKKMDAKKTEVKKASVKVEVKNVKKSDVKKVDVKNVKKSDVKKVDVKNVKKSDVKKVDVKNVKKANVKKVDAKNVKKSDIKKVDVKNIKKDLKTPETKKQAPVINTPAAKPQVVEKGHLVSVEYVGTLSNGEEFDNSKAHGPIKFVVGKLQVIKGFDDAVVGMKINESKKVNIPKHEAYGDVNNTLIHKVPLDKLPPDMRGKVKAGGFLMLQTPVGQQIPAKVLTVNKDSVTLDLNHPLAGKDLNFEIKIVDISSGGTDTMSHDEADCVNPNCADGKCDDNCKH